MSRASDTAREAIRNFKDDLSIVLVPTGFSAIAAQFMVPQVGEGARIFLFVVSLVAAWKLFDVFGAAHVAVVSVIPINYPNKQEGTKA